RDRRDRACRSGAQSHSLYLDPGERVDGARRPRAGAGRADDLARGGRREDARRAQSQPAPERPAAAAARDEYRRQRRASRRHRLRAVAGPPTGPAPADEKGFKIERKYYTLAGPPADPTKAKQNDRFAVVLKITEPQPQFGRIIVADYLPAGFEIDNPRLVSSG